MIPKITRKSIKIVYVVTIWIHIHMFFDPIVVELNMPTSSLVLKKSPKAWHCIGIITHSNSKEQEVPQDRGVLWDQEVL